MSIEREIEKCLGPFVDAVATIVQKKFSDRNGHIIGTERIWGYICNIHDQEDDELYGTVDVQEYDYEAPEGLHEGVYISALSDNSSGQRIVPTLYSDVMIATDPSTLTEYIVMTSHVDDTQIKSHVSTTVGVAETEEFVEGDEGDDVSDLKETGNFAKSSYDKNRIKHHYKSKDGEDLYSEYTKSHIIHKVSTSGGETTVEQLGDKIVIKAGDSAITISGDGSINIKSSNVTVEGDKVEVKGSQLIRKGTANTDMQGGFCGIPVCPFTGAPHSGSIITQ